MNLQETGAQEVAITVRLPLQGTTCLNLSGHTAMGKHGKEYPRYACSTARKHGGSQCQRYGIPAPDLEARVIAEVRAFFATDCCKDFLREGLERELAERERVLAAKKDLAALAAKKQALFDLLTHENLTMFRQQIDQKEG